MTQANKLQPNILLKLVGYLKSSENEYLPWHVFIDCLAYFKQIIKTTALAESLEDYLKDIVKPTYFKLTWLDNPKDSRLTRYYLDLLTLKINISLFWNFI